jgi:hypothetical protein
MVTHSPSGPRAETQRRTTRRRQRQIELFNSESLIDILFRKGIVLKLKINVTRACRRAEFDNPRARRRLVEPWRV